MQTRRIRNAVEEANPQSSLGREQRSRADHLSDRVGFAPAALQSFLFSSIENIKQTAQDRGSAVCSKENSTCCVSGGRANEA